MGVVIRFKPLYKWLLDSNMKGVLSGAALVGALPQCASNNYNDDLKKFDLTARKPRLKKVGF